MRICADDACEADDDVVGDVAAFVRAERRVEWIEMIE
jgi:hypothetical protein